MGEVPSAYRCLHDEEVCCVGYAYDDANNPDHTVGIIEVDDERRASFAKLCEPSKTSLTLKFQAQGQHRVLTFTEAPLGIVFKAKIPLEVKAVEPGSLAERLDVEPGWHIEKVNGEYVLHKDWKYVVKKVGELAKELPQVRSHLASCSPEALQLDFEDEGQIRSVRCYRSPLGLLLSPHCNNPLVVWSVQPNGHAEQLGIKKGWELLGVGGKSVIGQDPQDVMDSITSAIARTLVPPQNVERAHKCGELALEKSELTESSFEQEASWLSHEQLSATSQSLVRHQESPPNHDRNDDAFLLEGLDSQG